MVDTSTGLASAAFETLGQTASSSTAAAAAAAAAATAATTTASASSASLFSLHAPLAALQVYLDACESMVFGSSENENVWTGTVVPALLVIGTVTGLVGLCTKWFGAGGSSARAASGGGFAVRKSVAKSVEPLITPLDAVATEGGLAARNQGEQWVEDTLEQDSDGDEAHEFLGPFTSPGKQKTH